jgi:hypothetical protein
MCAKQEQVYDELCFDCNAAELDRINQPKVNKEYLHAQMKFHELQAMWWMHAASNGHAAARKVSHGLGGPLFTKEELRDSAMQTAKQHIDIIHELVEKLGKG